MKTTIAVNPKTLDLLKHAKEEARAGTYDELIQKLVLESKKPRESMFGKFKNVREFRREEADREF